MKIAIISDTHIRKNTEKIDSLISIHLKDIDSIIHVGDYVDKKVVDKLKEHKDFIGVYGNVDSKEIKEELNEEELIEVNGYKIGIFHGHGNNRSTIDRVHERFRNQKIDIIVFGHSHKPIIKTENKVLFLNPGSPTDKRREKWFSFIILELKENMINAQLRFFL